MLASNNMGRTPVESVDTHSRALSNVLKSTNSLRSRKETTGIGLMYLQEADDIDLQIDRSSIHRGSQKQSEISYLCKPSQGDVDGF